MNINTHTLKYCSFDIKKRERKFWVWTTYLPCQ